MDQERSCKECGEFFQGRADKKFCSDQCRNTFNNNLNSEENNRIRNVNRILKKNRRILLELNPVGKAVVSKERLLNRGFNLNYVTGHFATKKGSVYYYCYEQGFISAGNGYFTLVRRKDYID